MNNQNIKPVIFMVEDEPDIIELVSVNLEKEGFKVKGFLKAADFFQYIKRKLPDLFLLDIMLPDQSGLDICKQLQKESKTSSIPVIMLTAKGEELDKIIGLEIGADDYMTKPFSPRELVARIKAVLRRTQTKKEVKEIINLNNKILIDLKKHVVTVKNKEVTLTTTEFNILKALAEHKGWVLSRDQLLDILWGDEKIVVDRTIDVHIRHLRTKLGEMSTYIKNIRGVGYKLNL
jgi:two-component system phosphate regulon response regulator PhoB/two-component system alkaline phosphatase synthesis response regulator PhoP